MKKLIDAEAWLSQCSHAWMNYNLAKKIIREAPSYEVEESLLSPCVEELVAFPKTMPTSKPCLCRACGAEITWIKMPSGRSMPCNAEKTRYRAEQTGKERFVTERGNVVHGRSAQDGESWGYVSHFTTCPHADEFRRRD